MRLIAVRPMARPMSARRSRGPSTAPGAAGWKRTIAKPDAEIMNRPRPQASIRYSGQWRFTALVMTRDTTPRGGQGVRAPFGGWRCPMPHDSSNGSKEASMDDQPLRGQRALVTGASSGIGEGVARALGAAGASVVVNFASKPDIAAKIVEEIKTSGVDAMALHADVSKEAEVEAMFSAMLSAWGQIDIRVNSIAPGAIMTPINRAAWETPEALRSLLTLIPYGRVGTPADIGRAVAWLASDDADYIHGQTIYVDGGMTLYPEFAKGG